MLFILMLVWWTTWLGGRSGFISIEGSDQSDSLPGAVWSGVVDRHVCLGIKGLGLLSEESNNSING